jgi:lipopolysaccharide export system protein LptA
MLLLPVVQPANAQGGSKVQILNADALVYDQARSGKVRKLIGNVQLRQDNTLLYCDSAYQHEATNFVEAFSNVRINHNDSVNVWGDHLRYDGNTRMARMERNVRMTDGGLILTCDELDFDLENNRSSYSTGGRLVSDNNLLTSRYGYYYSRTREVHFRRDVVLVNPDYTINCDTLKYNTVTRTAYFFGPTTITTRDERMYCELGQYNMVNEVARFSRNAEIITKGQVLKADSLYYEKKTGFGRAFRNIELVDTANKAVVYGDFGELDGRLKQNFVTRRAVAVRMMEGDSMYLFADTIYSYDKTEHQEALVKAYRNAKIIKSDMQAVCDSLVYSYADSSVLLYKEPMLWSEQNQVTADTIIMYINNSRLDSFDLNSNAFVISKEASQQYNQVKGRNMKGRFDSSRIEYIRVFGNGQSIYYMKEDSGYIGVNVIDCSEMEFFFAGNKLSKGNWITKPDAVFYPLGELSPEELKLRGFHWHSYRRPGKKLVKQRFKSAL